MASIPNNGRTNRSRKILETIEERAYSSLMLHCAVTTKFPQLMVDSRIVNLQHD